MPSPRIIALMNQKGGVGKTTTTVNLGAALAEAGHRVCLIDLDPQAHLSINYNIEPGGGAGGGGSGGGGSGGGADDGDEGAIDLYDVLVEDRPLIDAVRHVTDRIDVIPSSIDLAAAEIELVSVIGRELLLKKRLEAARAAGLSFDYLLLDCPPSLGLLTINALAMSDEVIVPMQAHFLALQGVAKLLETVQLVQKRMNPKLRVSGIALTMFDSQTRLSTEVVNELKGFIESAAGKNLPWSDAKLFDTRIRRNIKLAESPSFGLTIFNYEPSSNGATDYRALAVEVMAMKPPASSAAMPAAAPTAAPLPKVEVTIHPTAARQPA